MTKKHSTKRALILSALSLLICISMLIGSTFAWFTDSVTSANNIIKSGNLDVELYYQLEGESAWTKVSETTNVFKKDALWEPGHTEVVKLKVANEGSLALKYQLSVNVVNEIGSTNMAGDEFKLSDYIKYGIVDGNQTFNRDQAVSAVDTFAKSLNTIYGSGAVKLLPENEKIVTMVVYMPTSVGNEANHATGATAPQIDLGINVYATQVTEEADSFDNQYDKYTEVFTVEDANAAMADGEDATLVNCVDPQGILYAPTDYEGKLTIVNSSVKSVQADGDLDLVILGDVTVNAKGSDVSTFALKAFDGSAIAAKRNLTVTGNGNLTAIAADMNAAYGIGGANVSIKGITIDNVTGGHAYGVGTDTKYYKDAPEGGAAIGAANGGTITLEKVTVTNAIGGSKCAAIGARYHSSVTVNITDSTIAYAEGGVSAAGIGSSRVSSGATEAGSSINIKGSTVCAKGGAYGAGIGSGYDTHCQANQPICTINIDDSTINATGGQYAAGIGTGYHNAALAGEIKNSTVTAASGEKIYKSSYTAAMDVGFGVVDPAREGQQTASKLIYNGTEITLATAPDIVEPSETLANAITDNANIVLVEGNYTLPSLSGKEGVTIIGDPNGGTTFNAVNSFSFGKDTVLKNVTFKTSGSSSVRYATTSGDVVYENCVFEGKQYGYHVDNANGGTVTFNNCTFYGRNALASTGTYFFNNCQFKYTYSNYNTTNIYSTATFNNCKWDSKLELYIDNGAKAIVDGDTITERTVFIADARGLESFQQNVNWKNNTYAGVTVMLSADIDMKDAYYANWTPIGQTGATQFMGTFDGHGYTIKNLNINTTSQTGKNYSTGLFGWLNNATVKNLTIDGANVKGNHNVGVIAGYMEAAGCTISNCHVKNATVFGNHANDDACGDKVGVIAGFAANAGTVVENCSAANCTVTAGRDAGQIVGAALTANVTGCTATNVTVTASGDCTGKNINNEVIGRVTG